MAFNPYSNLKIFWHPEKLNSILKGRVSAPIYVRIKPTNICNHKCFYCSYTDYDLRLRKKVNIKDQIPWSTLKDTISGLANIGVKAVTFSGGGEPLIYSQINEAFKLVLGKGMDLSLITNGQLLCAETAKILTRAKWVRISLDTCNAKTFSRIRNVPEKLFYELSNNIRNFSRIKDKECELGINFVVNHENANQSYVMAKFAKELGVGHIKYTARITKDLFDYHKKFKHSAIKQIERAKNDFGDNHFKVVDKYTDDFSLCMVFKRSYPRCFTMQIITVIGADGKVYLCHDKTYVPGGALGDLNKNSFKEIWFSPKTESIFRNFDPRKECRHHCVYDQRNILLNEAFRCADNQVNFI